MLLSIALILISGIVLGGICKRLRLPSLVGMILAGMLLSPYAFSLMDDKLLSIAPDLRQIALVIILSKAGLSLDLQDLKKVGRPALLMCFVPACFEIVGVVLLAVPLLNLSISEALLLGSVLAAVSPAVIVPRMLMLMEKGYGRKHSIPQLILAGASLDDIFVIVLFASFMSLQQSNQFQLLDFIQIPTSIGLGILLGVGCGLALIYVFKKIHTRDSIKVLLLLSVSFLFITLQEALKGSITISGLVAIMMIGITMKKKYPELAIRLSNKYNKLWVGAEVILFVLVGVSIDTSYLAQAGMALVVVIIGALLVRMLGVALSLWKSPLTKKERIFCMGAYCPKATVQAAIGTLPLAAGLACGHTILSAAVAAILITAPLGSFFIETYYKRLLQKD